MTHFILTSFILISTSYAQFEALPSKPHIPANNPQTADKIELGKKLYFDRRLSKDYSVSCNSCHNVMEGGEDHQVTSKGVKGQRGGRNSPTVWNSAFMSAQFWDGRAPNLEEQAKGPLLNPVEMGMENGDAVMNRVKAIPDYVADFEKVFGKGNVGFDQLAQAIAAYERTLITPNSNFDKFKKGKWRVLSAQARRGMQKFQDVGCISCHMGPNFAGPALPEGTGFYQKFPTYTDNEFEKKYKFSQDPGRYEATKNSSDKNMWRVPSLRNIELTAPYFHTGKVQTLEEAVRIMAKTQLNKDLHAAEVADIVAFLKSLTGERPKQTIPKLPKAGVK